MDEKIINIQIENNCIRANRYISGNEPFVNGHYPHFTIFPGVLSMELLLELLKYYCSKQNIEGRISYINKIQYLGIIMPGDVLLVKIIQKKEEDNIIIFNGEILVDNSQKVRISIIFTKDEQ